MIGWLMGWKAKVLAAVAAILVLTASHGWAYWQGRTDGNTATEVAWQAKETAREQAARNATNEVFRRQAQRDVLREKEAADLRRKVQEHEDYIDAMADGECLVGPDADRLRDIWK